MPQREAGPESRAGHHSKSEINSASYKNPLSSIPPMGDRNPDKLKYGWRRNDAENHCY